MIYCLFFVVKKSLLTLERTVEKLFMNRSNSNYKYQKNSNYTYQKMMSLLDISSIW